MVSKKIQGESDSCADTYIDFLNNKLPKILAEYDLRDIYNADETALYFKHLPDRTLCFIREKPKGGKKRSDKLTLLIIANMDGSDKQTPWIIGKAEKPRRLKSVHKMEVRDLPVKYAATAKAWMTTDLWDHILSRWNRRLAKAGRKIVLFADNASCHGGGTLRYSNIRLEFLPPNTTALIQPCDQGILRSVKARYKNRVAKNYLAYYKAGIPINRFLNECDVKRCADFLIAEWRALESDVICASFRRAAWYRARIRGLERAAAELEKAEKARREKRTATEAEAAQEEEEEDTEIITPDDSPVPANVRPEDEPVWGELCDALDLPQAAKDNHDKFIDEEDNEPICEERTTEEIAEAVCGSSASEGEGEDDDDPEPVQCTPPTTFAEALEAVQKLRTFCQLKKFPEVHLKNIDFLEESVMNQQIRSSRQVSITAWMTDATSLSQRPPEESFHEIIEFPEQVNQPTEPVIPSTSPAGELVEPVQSVPKTPLKRQNALSLVGTPEKESSVPAAFQPLSASSPAKPPVPGPDKPPTPPGRNTGTKRPATFYARGKEASVSGKKRKMTREEALAAMSDASSGVDSSIDG